MSPVPLAELSLVASFFSWFSLPWVRVPEVLFFLVASHFLVEFAAELFPQCSLWVSQFQQVEVPSSRPSVDRIVLSVFLGDPTTIAFFFC